MKSNKGNNIRAMGQNMLNTLDIKWEHPAVTSLVSFSISYAAFNPLKQRMTSTEE